MRQGLAWVSMCSGCDGAGPPLARAAGAVRPVATLASSSQAGQVMVRIVALSFT